MSETELGLAKRSVKAFLWGAGGSAARIGLQLVTQIILARILGPTEYGIFAIGVIVIMLSTYFADVGIAYGLIQRQDVSEDDIRFVWTWQWILGVSVSSGIFLTADLLASLFGKPEAEFVFRWLAVISLLNALSSVSINLLKKSLDYKSIHIAQLVSYVAGYVGVGIPLALAGYGAEALVASWLVQTVCGFVLLYARVRHPVSFHLWKRGAGSLLAYGVTVLATNLINWFMVSLDKIVVGRIFPAHTVGLYTTAFNFVNAPASAAYTSLQAVVFSSCARLQNDRKALSEVFIRLVSAIAILAVPVFVLLSVAAEPTVVTVYGSKWSGAAPLLAAFALMMPFLLLWGVSTAILWNLGRIRFEAKLQVPMVIAWALILYGARDLSAEHIAALAAVIFALRCGAMVIAVCVALHLPLRTLGRAVQGGLFVAAAVGAAGLAAELLLQDAAMPAPVLLSFLVGAGAAAYVLLIAALAPVLISDHLRGSLTLVAQWMPRWTQPISAFLTRTWS